MTHFELILLCLGALLACGALISGLVHRSFLSLTVLFVLAGFALGDGGLGVLHFDLHSPFVEELAILALVVILFRDGLEVEGETLRDNWHLPLRKLVLAMPIACGIIAACAHWLLGLGWIESLLLGALLSPTDPILSGGVVGNPKVPQTIRHSLNLESGLNDGLALPAVLTFSAVLTADEDFVWWQFIAQDLTLGVLTGLIVGFVAAKALPRDDRHMPEHAKSLFALGVALAAYGIAMAPPHANGFVTVFVCAVTLGTLRDDIRLTFEQRSDDIVEIVKLGVFVVFGAVLSFEVLAAEGWMGLVFAAAVLALARPVAIFVALAGTRGRVDLTERLFMGWFGPKGIATVAFGLLVIHQDVPGGQHLFNIAALVVFCSILAHSTSDTPAAAWIGRRHAAKAPHAADDTDDPPSLKLAA